MPGVPSDTITWLGGESGGKRMVTDPRRFSPGEIGVKMTGGTGEGEGLGGMKNWRRVDDGLWVGACWFLGVSDIDGGGRNGRGV